MGDNPSHYHNGDNYPVERVTCPELKRFAEKLSSLSKGAYEFRLPSEAEWEYACRSGGKPQKYAGGSDLDQVAWYHGNSNRSTHAVATKAPNGLSLFDMNGNVNEWCEDVYRAWAYGKHKRNNPIFREEADLAHTAVYRGGSWKSGPKDSRCAARNYEISIGRPPGLAPYRSDDTGFRLVRNK